MTTHLLRKSALGLILVLSAPGFSKAFAQSVPHLPPPPPPSPDGTTGGDPVPIKPGAPSVIALHLG